MGGATIHPTAIVDPAAELGVGVMVGPWSLVGPEVRLEDGAEVGAHVVLEGRIRVGPRTRIGHGAAVGGLPQDLKYRPGTSSGVVVGADTVVREQVTVHRATREGADTRIGDRCLVMAMSHVAHDCVIGNDVIIINYAGLTGHVVVEDRATVGGHTGIHPFGRIGTYAYVGGLAAVHQDVPPFTIAEGAPARARSVNVIGMRRGGIPAADRQAVQRAFRLLYRSGLSPGAALGRIRAELPPHPLVGRLVTFVEASQLGIVKAAQTSGPDDDGEEQET